MGSFKVSFKSSAEKDLRRIEKAQIAKIVATITELASNPFPNNSRKLVATEKTYRVRVGDYRVIYIVDSTDHNIEIQRIAHRKDAYR